MTIRVKIEHTQPGYDKAITVETVSVDVNGDPIRREPAMKAVVEPGSTGEWFYVYGGQALIVTEGPAATPQPPANAE